MTSESLDKYRTRLEKEREQLMKRHERHDQDLRESHATDDIAGGDRAAEWEEVEVESRIVESEERLLEKIAYALVRIEEGTYGNCEACGQAIPEARLDAKPSVSLCVPCQEEKEAAS